MKAKAKQRASDAYSWLSDPRHRPLLGGIVLAWVSFLGLTCYCALRWWKRQQLQKHVQLKETDDTGMPPQIVGGDAIDTETFVIGDDDIDAEDEGFEYVHDVEMAPPSSNASSPAPEHLRSTARDEAFDQGELPAFAGPEQDSLL
jgi:hypothetical protein